MFGNKGSKMSNHSNLVTEGNPIAFIFPEIYDTTPEHRGFVLAVINKQLNIYRINNITKSIKKMYDVGVGDPIYALVCLNNCYEISTLHIYGISDDNVSSYNSSSIDIKFVYNKSYDQRFFNNVNANINVNANTYAFNTIYGLDLKKRFPGLKQSYRPRISNYEYLNTFKSKQNAGFFTKNKNINIILSDGIKHVFSMEINKSENHNEYKISNIIYQQFKDNRYNPYDAYFFINNKKPEIQRYTMLSNNTSISHDSEV